MRKIKTPPFTTEQVKECLSREKYKTIREIGTEVAKKINKQFSRLSDGFVNALRAILLHLTTYNSAKSYQNNEGEEMFALA